MTLTRSKDRKVAAYLPVANSFGLPSGRAYSCPGQTSICEKICYAGKLEKIYKGVRGVMLRNWEALQDKSSTEMATLINEMLAAFVAECDKKSVEKKFRIHWDGDFFSRDYAWAWRKAITDNPEITFWVYTRSFTPDMNVIDILADLDNLALYLSVDSENINHAKETRKKFPSARWAYLAQTFDDAAPVMREVTGKVGAMCPENAKRIPLINDAKQGACISCNLCVEGIADVRFSVSKK